MDDQLTPGGITMMQVGPGELWAVYGFTHGSEEPVITRVPLLGLAVLPGGEVVGVGRCPTTEQVFRTDQNDIEGDDVPQVGRVSGLHGDFQRRAARKRRMRLVVVRAMRGTP